MLEHTKETAHPGGRRRRDLCGAWTDDMAAGPGGAACDLGHPLFPDGGADRQQDARRLRTVRPGMRGGGGTGGQRPGSSGGGRRGCGAVFGLRGCAAVPRYGGADLHHFHRPAGDPAGKEAVVPGGGGRGAVSGSRRDLRDPVPGSPGPCHRLGRGGHFAGSGSLVRPAAASGRTGASGPGQPAGTGRVAAAGAGGPDGDGRLPGQGAAVSFGALHRLPERGGDRRGSGHGHRPCGGLLHRDRCGALRRGLRPRRAAGRHPDGTAPQCGCSGLCGGFPAGAAAGPGRDGPAAVGRGGPGRHGVFAAAGAALWRKAGPAGGPAGVGGAGAGAAQVPADPDGGSAAGPLRQYGPGCPGVQRGKPGYHLRPGSGEGLPGLRTVRPLLAEGVHRHLQCPQRRHSLPAGAGTGPAQGLSRLRTGASTCRTFSRR